MEIVNPNIERYLLECQSHGDPVLLEMEQFAYKENFPVVGPLVGKLLFSLSKIISARSVLEMGSGFGYSAYWLAKAVQPDGKVVCLEGSNANKARAEKYLTKGKVWQNTEFEVGDALKCVAHHPGPFDIVFIDIDKEEYPEAFKKAMPRLRKGGLLIADNVLWSGKVVTSEKSPATRGILEFTRLIFSSRELVSFVVPLRDGVSVSVRI